MDDSTANRPCPVDLAATDHVAPWPTDFEAALSDCNPIGLYSPTRTSGTGRLAGLLLSAETQYLGPRSFDSATSIAILQP